jgi:hypothetical protein
MTNSSIAFLKIANIFSRQNLKRGFWRQIWTGLPDFSWYNTPKRGKIYQITTNYTKCP